MAARSVFACALCTNFAASSYLPVLRHIGSTHRIGPTQTIHCGIDGCPATYSTSKFESFRSHVYRKHRDVLYLENNPSQNDCIGGYGNDMGELYIEDNEEPCGMVPATASATVNTSHGIIAGSKIKKQAALFQLQALEERRLTQSALNGIITDIQSLWDTSLNDIQQELYARGIDIELRNALLPQVIQPFLGLETTYQQQQYFGQSLGLIVRCVTV